MNYFDGKSFVVEPCQGFSCKPTVHLFLPMLSTLIQSAYNSIQDAILLVHPDTSEILFTNEYFHTRFGKQRVKFTDLFPTIELPFKDKTTMNIGSSKIVVEISTGTLTQGLTNLMFCYVVTLKTESVLLTATISRYEAEYQGNYVINVRTSKNRIRRIWCCLQGKKLIGWSRIRNQKRYIDS